MKISNELLNELTMIAQQVLAPDEIGMDVHIHLSTGLVYDAVKAVVEAMPDGPEAEPTKEELRRTKFQKWLTTVGLNAQDT